MGHTHMAKTQVNVSKTIEGSRLQSQGCTLWHMLILALGWAPVCPADTARAVVSQGGAVRGMPRGTWTVHAVTVLFPLGAMLVTQVHGFFCEFLFVRGFSYILLCTALTPLLPKVVHPPHDLSRVMQHDVTQFLCGGLLCQ